MEFEFITTVGIIVLIIAVVTLLKSVTTVRQYERGIVEGMRTEVLQRLAEMIGGLEVA